MIEISSRTILSFTFLHKNLYYYIYIQEEILYLMSYRSYNFTHAITRKPSKAVVRGLTSQDRGVPDFKLMNIHHMDYVKALKKAGANVIELDALEDFPDSTFVEDTALCLPEGAVIMKPGAPSRLKEVNYIEPQLSELYREVYRIEGKGTIEAGDILTTESEILVGRSERTSAEGVSELKEIVSKWGYKVTEVITPPEILHFKTDCSLLNNDTILSTERLASTGCFKNYNIILTCDGEEEAANTVRYNEWIIMADSFINTTKRLIDCGFKVLKVGNTECAKIDGGMSCLSLRFTPHA